MGGREERSASRPGRSTLASTPLGFLERKERQVDFQFPRHLPQLSFLAPLPPSLVPTVFRASSPSGLSTPLHLWSPPKAHGCRPSPSVSVRNSQNQVQSFQTTQGTDTSQKVPLPPTSVPQWRERNPRKPKEKEITQDPEEEGYL